MHDLVIVGAGGHAKVVVEAALVQEKYKIIGLLSDSAQPDEKLLGFPVKRHLEDLPKTKAAFIVAIGDNKIRKEKFENFLQLGWEPATIIHPTALISRFCKIGAGSLICLRASICTDAEVAENVIINSAAIVEHECTIGAHSHVSVGVNLAGRTKIGEGCFIGISSCTIPEIKIGAWSTVGAGAAVIRDLEPNSLVGGVPAKPLRSGLLTRLEAPKT